MSDKRTNNFRPAAGPPGRGPMGGGHRAAMMSNEKAKNFKATIIRLSGYLKKYKPTLVLVFICSVASTVFLIIGPRILGKATTALFEGVMAQIAGTGSVDFIYIGKIIIFVIAIYLGSSLFSFVMGWLMSGVSADITYRFRRDVSLKINKIPFNYYDNTTHGETLSRITNDIDTINQTLSQSLTQIITSVVTLVGVLVMMFSIDWRMTLIAIGMLPVSMVLVSLIVKNSQRFFKQQQDYLGHINGHVEEMFSGHMVMKAFNGEEESIRIFEENNTTLFSSAWKSQFLSGMMMPLMRFVGNLGYVAVTIFGGWLVIQRAITLGDVQAFIQYVNNFTQPINQIANISNVLQRTAAAAERVFEFLDEEQEIAETRDPVTLDTVEGLVEFKNVHFGYDPENPVIKNFSAKAEPGRKIAIVGPTGAGKTTMVKLLMRFYDIQSGEILVDGHDLKEFRREDLRRNFGMVLQDTWLYNGTIRENIRYGNLEASEEDIVRATEAAHADHFIRTLPDGYDMMLNEETTNISQGQRQLLTIARAILADPKILILDEATSSVDTRTEELIQKAMDNLMAGRTSFVIAHRLSTIRNADLILVMNEGDIIEQGTHKQLLDSGGFYADLYNSQFESSSF